jgi:hypothetical protein
MTLTVVNITQNNIIHLLWVPWPEPASHNRCTKFTKQRSTL